MLNPKLTIPVLLTMFPVWCAANPAPPRVIGADDVASWSLGLIVVLSMFLLTAWLLKRLTGVSGQLTNKLRIIGVVPLGFREKVLLLQAGRKQLLLGVTPGRIETLHVFEGDDCIATETPKWPVSSGSFAEKLKQALTIKSDVTVNHD